MAASAASRAPGSPSPASATTRSNASARGFFAIARAAIRFKRHGFGIAARFAEHLAEHAERRGVAERRDAIDEPITSFVVGARRQLAEHRSERD